MASRITHPTTTLPNNLQWEIIPRILPSGRFGVVALVPGESDYTYRDRLYFVRYSDAAPPVPGTLLLLEEGAADERCSGFGFAVLPSGRLFVCRVRAQDLGAPPVAHYYLDYRTSDDEGATWSAWTAILSDWAFMLGAYVVATQTGAIYVYCLRYQTAPGTASYQLLLVGTPDSSGVYQFDATGELPTTLANVLPDGIHLQRSGAVVGSSGRRVGISSTGATAAYTHSYYAAHPAGSTVACAPAPLFAEAGFVRPLRYIQAGRHYLIVTHLDYNAGGTALVWDATTTSQSFETPTTFFTLGSGLVVDADGVIWFWYSEVTTFDLVLVSCRSWVRGSTTNAFA